MFLEIAVRNLCCIAFLLGQVLLEKWLRIPSHHNVFYILEGTASHSMKFLPHLTSDRWLVVVRSSEFINKKILKGCQWLEKVIRLIYTCISFIDCCIMVLDMKTEFVFWSLWEIDIKWVKLSSWQVLSLLVDSFGSKLGGYHNHLQTDLVGWYEECDWLLFRTCWKAVMQSTQAVPCSC